MPHPGPRVKPTDDDVPAIAPTPDAIVSLRRFAARNTRRSPLISLLVWLVLAMIGWGIVAIVIAFF